MHKLICGNYQEQKNGFESSFDLKKELTNKLSALSKPFAIFLASHLFSSHMLKNATKPTK